MPLRVVAVAFPLEAVPNFSEGRDQAVVHAIAEALGARAAPLDVHFDADHNRSVFTLAGSEQELVAALLEGVSAARERIDLRRHEGVHPCVGVADVLPIVAVRPEDMERARSCALELARRIGAELELPVFLYGELAAGRRLAELRRGGAVELARRMESVELEPDFGPATLDPRTGAVLVGARPPLIAFNVNLCGGLEAARQIAGLVREDGGGFAGVRALGLELRGVAFVQVSMNIEDWQKSGLAEIVTRIGREAAQRGVEVAGSELVGLIPIGAAAEAEQAGLLFAPSQILELRLAQTSDGELD
jgi:glutamate formiminotransferase